MDKGNVHLVKVALRASRDSGHSASRTGEPVYEIIDLTAGDYALFDWETWIDYSVARRVEIFAEKVEVQATWELREWIQNKLVELGANRGLRTGDVVQFDNSDRLFVLGASAEDAGLFASMKFYKFNLVFFKGRLVSA